MKQLLVDIRTFCNKPGVFLMVSNACIDRLMCIIVIKEINMLYQNHAISGTFANKNSVCAPENICISDHHAHYEKQWIYQMVASYII